MPQTRSSPDYSQAIGRRLRARREEIGLSQAAVARRLSVSASYVQNVEAGRANLTVGQLERVSEALDAYPRVELIPLGRPEAELDFLQELSSRSEQPDGDTTRPSRAV